MDMKKIQLLTRGFLITVVVFQLFSGPPCSAQAPASLAPGEEVRKEILGRQSHQYRVMLKPGQFARFSVSQNAVDLVLSLASPGDAAEKKTSAEIDLFNVGEIELLPFEVTIGGEYILTIRALSGEAMSGSYELKFELREPAGEADRRFLSAMNALSEIVAGAQTGKSAEQAIEKGKALLPVWRELKLPLYQACTLLAMGDASRMISRYEQAVGFLTEALASFRESKSPSGEADCQRSLGIAHSLLGDFAEGSVHFEESRRLAQTLSDRPRVGSLLANLGTNAKMLGKMEEAETFLGQALGIARELRNYSVEGITLHNLGEVAIGKGEEEKAIEILKQAIAIHRKLKSPFSEGTSLSSLATAYAKTYQFDLALQTYREALQIRRDQKDLNGEANTLLNIGILYNQYGIADKAIESHLAALAILQTVKNRIAEGNVFSHLGNAYKNSSQYEKSIDAHLKAIAIFTELKNPYHVGFSLYNLGIVYSDLRRYDKAIEYYELSLDSLRAAKEPVNIIYALNSLGAARVALKQFDKARVLYEEGLTWVNEIQDKDVKGRILNNLGEMSIELQQYDQARTYFQEALALFRETGNHYVESLTLYNIGRNCQLQKQYDQAIAFYQQSLALQIPGLRSQITATLYEGLADTKRRLGRIEEARGDYETAIQLQESLRANVEDQESRATLSAGGRSIYESYASLLMELHRADPGRNLNRLAFETSERMRARSLLELLNESRINVRADASPALIERERSLGTVLSNRAKELFESKSPVQKERLKREITRLETEYEQTQAAIRRSNPRYAALTQPQPLSLNDLQALLDDETTALEYSLGAEKSWVWAVSKTTLTAYELPAEKEINERAKRVYDLLTSRTRRFSGESPAQQRRRVASKDRELMAASRELSRMILSPIPAEMLNSKRLVVIPDGGLNYVPFSALPQSDGSQTILLAHEIVTLPSLSSLAIQRREMAGRKPVDGMVAVLADPVFGGDDSRLKVAKKIAVPEPSDLAALRIIDHLSNDSKLAAGKRRPLIPRLPFTRLEADRILELTPPGSSLKVTDFQASRKIIDDPRLGGYRYIHFATHGLADAERPGLSALVLSMVDEQGNPQDGFLRANEIYNLRLPAELVVLSACQTGLGKQIKGEGLVGLTRGFMYAGAKRVMVSLWNVNDQATSELMQRFYRKLLKENATPAEALRAAQMEMARHPKWNAPYYWAAFVLQGDWK